jgi:cellulose biosynthesis protein BcsQ
VSSARIVVRSAAACTRSESFAVSSTDLAGSFPPTRECVTAVANLKGGVGKTTTVLNMAGFAGQMGKRVLAVDTDPQGSLTRVALSDDGPTTSLSDAFARRAQSLDGMRCPSRFLGVDLVPSSLTLEVVNMSCSTR